MTVNGINNVGKSSRVHSTEQSLRVDNKSKVVPGKDSVSISQEALNAQELSKVTLEVQKTSDIRHERVEEIKAKMKRGDFDSLEDEILDKVAEKIAMALLN